MILLNSYLLFIITGQLCIYLLIYYFYSATNNTWDSSNQKVKILRAASRKFQCETIIVYKTIVLAKSDRPLQLTRAYMYK